MMISLTMNAKVIQCLTTQVQCSRGIFTEVKTKQRLSTLISERNELERSFIQNRYRLLRAHREIVANYSIFKAIEC